MMMMGVAGGASMIQKNTHKREKMGMEKEMWRKAEVRVKTAD